MHTEIPGRIPYRSVAPDGYKAFGRVHHYVAGCGLEPALVELIYLRVSQINGCAYCIDLHWREAVKAGLDHRKLNAVAAWHEAPFFTDRQRAALAWAECLTHVARTHAPDEDYRAVTVHFSEKEVCDLTYAVAVINAFNRMAVGHRLPVPEEA
ncbi:carboxymuconolactone decarboxylase family protein [Azospirillum sp.]|uniref:carboxymuconolactone decarboxylase family protein n=1 Tax=Azospirillum sp. TaxID=34012 RepID=UPI002D5B5996|nr:carboxymuconolactone decarboxylase family protein [Azospirillum sp.]HYD65459.1 carboxymuconolactone decarboxylase family protein [Azospirillum sp.]